MDLAIECEDNAVGCYHSYILGDDGVCKTNLEFV